MIGLSGSLCASERPSAYAIHELSEEFPGFADWYESLPTPDRNEVMRLIDKGVWESVRNAIREPDKFNAKEEPQKPAD